MGLSNMNNRVTAYRLVQGPTKVEAINRCPWAIHVGAGRVRAHARGGFRTKAQALAWSRRNPAFARRVGIHGVA